MMRNIAIMVLVIGGVLLAACGGKRLDHPETAPVKVETDGNLPLPSVPDSLTTPEERAAFVAAHFWDGMDWHDRRLSLDTAFMEQNFANYLTILPYADDNARRRSVASLMKSASADREAHAFLAWVAEHYLADPNSPMRSEDVYMIFLEEFVKSSLFDEAKRTRYEYQLERTLKNRPGSTAADFAMTDRDGKRLTLLKAAAQKEGTLVLFYDPECEHCKEILGEIAGWRFPDELQVLAIDVTGDAERFERTKGNYPVGWRVAFATDPIEDDDLYAFPALPSIYLLDGEGRVILKDAPVSAIASSIRME